MNRKGAEDSLCKKSHPRNVLNRQILTDYIKKWVLDMCSKFLCQIPNMYWQCFGCMFRIQGVSKKLDPLKKPQIQISRNLLYKLDSSECFELMIRKAAQDLTHLGILGRYYWFSVCVEPCVFLSRHSELSSLYNRLRLIWIAATSKGLLFLYILYIINSNMWKYYALVMFWKKMFIERRVMERHLLGGKSTLIFLVKYVKCSLKTIQHN